MMNDHPPIVQEALRRMDAIMKNGWPSQDVVGALTRAIAEAATACGETYDSVFEQTMAALENDPDLRR